ncbi:hypothetical protein HYW82_00570 [Candidatus Peregrinibacteria bacterium]|nr:hypothetical protein [Candidatus Peregrinibacteria bacterium]
MKKIVLLIVILFVNGVAHAEEIEGEIEGDGEEKGFSRSENLGKIFMESEFLDGDILRLSVLAKEMAAPVLGVSFHLPYNENLAFLKYEPGDFLERGGNPFYLVKNTGESRTIIFGETLRRDDNFPVGDGRIADFYFQILGDAEFEFEFLNGVISTMDSVRQDIDLIEWDGISADKNNPAGDFSANISGSQKGGKINFTAIAAAVFILGSAIFLIRKKYLKRRHKNF